MHWAGPGAARAGKSAECARDRGMLMPHAITDVAFTRFSSRTLQMAATHTYLDELVHIIEISDPHEGLSEEFYERIRNATLRALSCRVPRGAPKCWGY